MKQKLRLMMSMLLCMLFGMGTAWGQEVSYDFTGNDWTVSNGTLSNGTVSITGEGSTNFKMNSGYFILGKSGAYITLPTYDFDVEKIVVTGRSGASGSTNMNVYVGENAVSTETTGCTGTNTYEIASAYQAAGNAYTIKVTSNHNAQFTKIEIYKVTNNDPDGPGTANNPYTVAQARAAIDAGTGVTGVYATGIVSEIVTAYNSQYGNISYNISDDGSTTADQLLAFRGKGINGENFTSEDDIQVGDIVVIYGNLTLYETDTYEFAANNQLVSLVRPENPAVETATTIDANGITNTDVYTSTAAGSLTATVTANNETITDATVTWTSSNENVATIDANGTVTLVAAGTTTITASYAGVEEEYRASEATYELTVTNSKPVDPSTEETIIEDFEKQTASTKYDETKTYNAENSNCGIGWEMFYGSVSTNDKIADTNNAQMRLYSSQPETYPYIKTTTPVDGLTNIKFKARVSDTGIKFNLSASADGTTWSNIATDLQLTKAASSGVTDFDYDIPSGNQYIMISISTNTSKPASGNVKLGIDNVQFTSSITEPTDPDVTFASENISVNIGSTVQNEITGPSSLSYTYSSGNESIATVDAATGEVTGVATGETTITATWEATNRYNAGSVSYTVTVENKQGASASISERNLDTEDVTTATITTVPANLVVEYSSSDTDVATVEDGIVTAVAAGNASITVTWDEQTIDGTVYLAGSETFNIVVAASIQCVFEESYGLRFDFTQNGWGFPAGSANKEVEENSFKNTGKTIKLAGSTGEGYYYNSQGYLMLGKKEAYLELPPFDFDVVAIEITGASGASEKLTRNIYVGEIPVSEAHTNGKGSHVFFINEENQSAGTIYTIRLNTNYNAQITEIKVYKKDAFVEFTVTDAGYRTYCSTDGLDFSVASEGVKAYIIEGVDAEGSTNLVLTEVTKVPANTGLLIEAEAGTYYVAKSTDNDNANDVSQNQLVGVTEATEVEPSIIVLMTGNEGTGFYKTSKTFTVGANTAYLPLSVLETVAATPTTGEVKTFKMFGADDDTPTSINAITAEDLTGKDSVIYNLSGQCVVRPAKGIYIVNGKKVLVK